MQSINIADRSGDLAISFDAASGTYTVRSGAHQVALTTANRVTTRDYAHVFRAVSGTTTDDVVLYGNALSPNPSASAPLQLTYASFGFWRRNDAAANLTTQTFFLYGAPTEAANMPRTGSASYQGIAQGLVMSGGPASPAMRNFNGTATLNADFAASTITTNLNLGADGSYLGTGSISGDKFSGTFSSSRPTFNSGAFNGGFFGPAASEAGYTFRLLFFNPDPFAGATPAPSNTWYSGVVVTKKN